MLLIFPCCNNLISNSNCPSELVVAIKLPVSEKICNPIIGSLLNSSKKVILFVR